MPYKPEESYSAILEDAVLNLNKNQRRHNIIAVLRLLVFILFLGVLFFAGAKLGGLNLIIISLLFLVVFLSLVRLSAGLNTKIQYLKKVVSVYTNEINIIRGQLNVNPDGGEFTDPKHPYSLDLDIFGRGSVFHSLNRTCTTRGYHLLASGLIKQCISGKEILLNQQAVEELSEDIHWCLNFLASGLPDEEKKKNTVHGINPLLDWLKEKPVNSVYTPRIKGLLLWIPILNCLVIGSVIIFNLPYGFIVLPFIWNSIITLKYGKRIKEYHKNSSKSVKQLKTITQLCHYLESASFRSERLGALQAELKNEQSGASDEIKKLEKIAQAFDTRLNLMVVAFLNLTLLWDIRCMYRSDEWKDRNSDGIELWLDAIAGFDALISIAVYNFNNPEFALPEISDEVILSVQGLSHPLINHGQRVYNDFCIKDAGTISIITGANMAGKSTFLRTIGVNLILGMMGSNVCANAFKFKPMNLYSSMRNTDSIETGDSYFYAEIKRLQVLINQLKKGMEYFILLDEILKGTNSTDKLIGSRMCVKKLLSFDGKATGLIATHDIPLTDMVNEFPENIQNYCFEASVIGKKVRCDYKIREGVTKKMNALLLMEELEIIDSGDDDFLPENHIAPSARFKL